MQEAALPQPAGRKVSVPIVTLGAYAEVPKLKTDH
jgi:hypothetical protein